MSARIDTTNFASGVDDSVRYTILFLGDGRRIEIEDSHHSGVAVGYMCIVGRQLCEVSPTGVMPSWHGTEAYGNIVLKH